MRPSLRQIETFLAVAATGSFSRAAERLGMSQPALSQAVRDLETGLGLRLLDRTTRRVELTAAGTAFRARVAHALDEIDLAARHARDLADLRAGHLRIAAPPLLAAAVLPRAMVRFAAAHPGITFDLADVGTEEMLARLRTGRADLAVGTFPADEPDIDRRPLLRDNLMLFCPPGHPLTTGAAPAWAALAGQPVITLTRDSGIRLLVEIGFERAGLALRPAFEVTQIATALALVTAGLGVAVLPGYARAAEAAQGTAALALAGPPMGREISIAFARDRSHPPAAAAFADHLTAALRAVAPG